MQETLDYSITLKRNNDLVAVAVKQVLGRTTNDFASSRSDSARTVNTTVNSLETKYYRDKSKLNDAKFAYSAITKVNDNNNFSFLTPEQIALNAVLEENRDSYNKLSEFLPDIFHPLSDKDCYIFVTVKSLKALYKVDTLDKNDYLKETNLYKKTAKRMVKETIDMLIHRKQLASLDKKDWASIKTILNTILLGIHAGTINDENKNRIHSHFILLLALKNTKEGRTFRENLMHRVKKAIEAKKNKIILYSEENKATDNLNKAINYLIGKDKSQIAPKGMSTIFCLNCSRIAKVFTKKEVITVKDKEELNYQIIFKYFQNENYSSIRYTSKGDTQTYLGSNNQQDLSNDLGLNNLFLAIYYAVQNNLRLNIFMEGKVTEIETIIGRKVLAMSFEAYQKAILKVYKHKLKKKEDKVIKRSEIEEDIEITAEDMEKAYPSNPPATRFNKPLPNVFPSRKSVTMRI